MHSLFCEQKKNVNVTKKLTKKSKDKNMQVNWSSKRKNQRKHGIQQCVSEKFGTLEILNWWS